MFQFKITLKYTKPPIWRRIQVPEDYTFKKFSDAILQAMGWNNRHLHRFHKGRNFEIRDKESMVDFEFMDDVEDENKIKLCDFFKVPKDSIGYEYDFGDSWEHNIVLEKILPDKDGQNGPVCIAGKRACPPDDCGSVEGYYELIEIISKPNHPEHVEMKTWLKDIGLEDWDPTNFDPKEVDFSNPLF